MKCEFVIGQKVVCIKKGDWRDGSPTGPIVDAPCPTYGEVCTILGIYPWRSYIMLVIDGYSRGYANFQFRAIIEPDISVFEDLLADVNAGKPVGVPA